MVAAARKLVVIAWHMLTRDEPYRYAIPRSTEDKLRRLRVKATGKRRRGGSPKGTKSLSLLPGGGRTVKSLPRICREEGLPAPHQLSWGERRMIAQSDADEYVASLQND